MTALATLQSDLRDHPEPENVPVYDPDDWEAASQFGALLAAGLVVLGLLLLIRIIAAAVWGL